MKIRLTSLFVDDQAKALAFYTDILGFVKKTDMPVGEFRWLTVVSSEGSNDIELVLEPNSNDAAKAYQTALHEQGIAATAFASENVQQDFERLTAKGVHFKIPPTEAGTTTIAVFDDTCGNLIQIYQE
jgi:catechol 2,3-dioxygenase-like lactoylglutathione lyase family enzyme